MTTVAAQRTDQFWRALAAAGDLLRQHTGPALRAAWLRREPLVVALVLLLALAGGQVFTLVHLLSRATLAATLTTVTAAGFLLGWEARRARQAGATVGFWNARRWWAATGYCDCMFLFIGQAFPGVVLLAVALVVLVGMVKYRVPSQSKHPLRAASDITAALLRVGAYPKGATPTIRCLGRLVEDEWGAHRTVQLDGLHWDAVAGKRKQLAAHWSVKDEALLTVEQAPGQGVDVAVLRIDNGTPRPQVEAPGPVRSPLADAVRTDWRTPIRIGTDAATGEVVYLDTDEQNTMLGGKPGFGKTNIGRIVLAHYLLDPTTTVYGLDGKGSRGDYSMIRPLCARWVWGTDGDAPQALEAMLREVLGLVQERNSADDDSNLPGVLLFLEELQDVRAGAEDKATAESIDKLLGRVIRMGRAAATQMLFSTQRPTANDIPAGVRNLVSQNLALVLRNPADAALVLGTAPDLPLPTRRGEGLLATPAAVRAVHLDLLTREDMRAVCERAAVLRAANAPVSLVKPTPIPTAPAVLSAPVDPLLAAVTPFLRTGPMTTTALLQSLPGYLRPASREALGRALAKLARDTGQLANRGGRVPAWQLTTATGTPTGTPTEPSREGSEGAFHAQTAVRTAQPSQLTTVP